jgi:hypothetical protein
MTTTVATTPILENEQLGVLEGMLTPFKDAVKDNDMVELCLHVYGKADGPMTVPQLVGLCREEFKGHVDNENMVQAVSRMISDEAMLAPGFIEKKTDAAGQLTFAVTDKGMAYLWDKLSSRNPDEVFDKFGKVMALNKKLNSPDRVIESHDLYALTLLAIMRIRKKDATATDVRKILETWVQPSGHNAEVLESEKKYPNPMNRFQRKFHNMFSSHNQIAKDGLIERVTSTSESKETWRVTEKGKAVLMRRIQKDRRNLTLQMHNAVLKESLSTHVAALNLIGYYDSTSLSDEERNALMVVTRMIGAKVKEDHNQIKEISNLLATPETVSAASRPKPRR